MRTVKIALIVLGFATMLVAGQVLFTGTENTPGIPTAFSNSQTPFQQQTHFLVFTGSDTPGENSKTAKAYYNAIDPTQSKRTFQQWLVNAGFIGNASQWHPTGPQLIACDLGAANGCDLPAHDAQGHLVYGDNIINTDSHAIVLNAADLGFVRNQFVRCKPSCSAPNPIIYTYLENYPVNPFAEKARNGSGFPDFTGYPTQAEAKLAISSALTRPLGDLPGCIAGDTILKCSIQRIADVAFEWAPPPNNPSSSTRYGQLYAFIFSADGSGIGDAVHTQETINVPAPGFAPNLANGTFQTPDVAAHTLNLINQGDPFPPNLDFIGFKQHPGVCYICHGGKPAKLTSTGAYPNQGNVSGFRYLPLDNRNLMFTSASGGEQPAKGTISSPVPGSVAFTDQAHQEVQIKLYNQAVLATVPTYKENDGTGSTRVATLREVIIGWYAGFPGDQTMSGNVQDSNFIPVAWREPAHGGTAPANSEKLYLQVVGPSCRSCHFNREISLDFGTPANFKQESDILQLALIAQCKKSNPDKNAKFMPLAHLTYQKYWQANPSTGGTSITLPDGLVISNTADQIAAYFGFGNVAGYCATNP